MADIGTLIMKIKADSSNFEKGMSKISSTVGGIAKTVGTASIAMTAAVGAVGIKATLMGADAEEMRNKYDVVFSDMTDTVDEWASNYSDAVGRSKFDIQESVSNLADLQQGLGMTQEESFNLSKQIVELGTDLASFNNVNDADAIDAISKAMLGEADSAKQLGLLLNVDRVKEFAEAQGLVYNEMTDAAKANLVYELAVTQSQNAIGDAERSSQSFTNQMKKLKTSVSDTVTEMGMKLIPVATNIVQKINNDVVPMLEVWIDKGIEVGSAMIDKLKPGIEKVVTFIQNNMPAIKETAAGVFEKIKEVASGVSTFFTTELIPIFERLGDWWDTNGEGVKIIAADVFDGVKKSAKVVWDFFSNNLLPIIGSVSEFIVQNYPAMKDTAVSVFEDIKAIIDPIWKMINDSFIPAIDDLVKGATEKFPVFLKATQDNFGLIADIIVPIVEAMSEYLELYDKISNKIGIKSWDEWDTPETSNVGWGDQYGMNSGTSDYNAYGNQYDAYKSGLYTPASGNSTTSNVTVNVSGNTIMNDRDATKLGNMITDRLKGVNIK